ncbi:hypothetical protein [Actinoplanes auranticolor]|uniref:Uncharacterized protein n=1 Tax=Actinoplanes auranticolor TaxID=47988 RepID=A0A919SFI6_9ACTN|nr:hypothetical protein [Actinoplanes auranticolor]GIM70724.1 hypothetical protein Aau02nite_42380 [Actinoplanes auranticolor]
MTETVRQQLCLIAAGTGALTALVALDVVAGPRLGIADHETLISLTRRLALWMTAACLSFVALRPLRPTVRTGR